MAIIKVSSVKVAAGSVEDMESAIWKTVLAHLESATKQMNTNLSDVALDKLVITPVINDDCTVGAVILTSVEEAKSLKSLMSTDWRLYG